MKPGKMRYMVTILSRADTQDEYGNALDEWNEDFTCWADIVPFTGREYFSAEQSVSETQYKVYIRCRDSITAKMRIRHKDTEYEILSVLGDRRSGMLTLMVKVVL